jgi:glyceraldehyde 3-phosphate dehydrogenase
VHAGRLVLRVAWDNPEVYNITTINDIAAPESIAYLLQYDSIHGTWKCKVEMGEDGHLSITEGDRIQKIRITQEKDISKVSGYMFGFFHA